MELMCSHIEDFRMAGDWWRANIYRIDYDELPCSHWAWDSSTGSDFQDYAQFGNVAFGGTINKRSQTLTGMNGAYEQQPVLS